MRLGNRRPVADNVVRINLLAVKILIVLIFVTIALGLVVSVKIHSLEYPLDGSSSSLHHNQHPLSAALSTSKSSQQQQQQQQQPFPVNSEVSSGDGASAEPQDPEQVQLILNKPLSETILSSKSQQQQQHQQQRDVSTNDIKSAVLQDPQRQPILKILREAGYDFDDTRIFTPETWESLPKWSDVLELYGDEPKIFGLETCERFRQEINDPKKREVGVAGMFNSGTNILMTMLQLNCQNRHRSKGTGILWQVPWGKHMPVSERMQHTSKGAENKNHTHALPVVSVRDPYTWMQSMCRQSYIVQFDHSTDPERNLCPNIVPYEEDIRVHPRYRKVKYMPAHAHYIKGLHIAYPSIAHLWNEWYNAYFNATDFPRLIVRMEDVVFQAEKVLPKICECFGGSYKHDPNKVIRHADVVNRNSGIDTSAGSGLLRSVIKYGNKALRRKHYQTIQLEAAKEVLDPHLMELFGYSYEDP